MRFTLQMSRYGLWQLMYGNVAQIQKITLPAALLGYKRHEAAPLAQLLADMIRYDHGVVAARECGGRARGHHGSLRGTFSINSLPSTGALAEDEDSVGATDVDTNGSATNQRRSAVGSVAARQGEGAGGNVTQRQRGTGDVARKVR